MFEVRTKNRKRFFCVPKKDSSLGTLLHIFLHTKNTQLKGVKWSNPDVRSFRVVHTCIHEFVVLIHNVFPVQHQTVCVAKKKQHRIKRVSKMCLRRC